MPRPPHTVFPPSVTVPASLHGQRLDAALALLFPGSSIRERRRKVQEHTILLNGRPAAKGHTVCEGDILSLQQSAGQSAASDDTDAVAGDLACHVRIVHQTAAYAVLFKPGGMHTASIAGGDAHSLEALLPRLFADAPVPPVTANRLDQLTSGMVLVAFSPEHAAAFRTQEDAGAVEKLYLAVARGAIAAPMLMDNALDTAKRKVTRVLSHAAESPLRHTSVLPLARVTLDGNEHTVVLASIHKGARHQIRAHLAHAGHPIAGDPIYGIDTAHSGPLYLHHYHLEFGSFCATCPPPPSWTEWSDWLAKGIGLPQSQCDT